MSDWLSLTGWSYPFVAPSRCLPIGRFGAADRPRKATELNWQNREEKDSGCSAKSKLVVAISRRGRLADEAGKNGVSDFPNPIDDRDGGTKPQPFVNLLA